MSEANIPLYAGDDKIIEIPVKDITGTPVDLTSATIEWDLSQRGSTTALLKKTTSSGISITDAAGGVFCVTLVPADTSALTAGYYDHQAVLTDSSGKVSTLDLAVPLIRIKKRSVYPTH